jgi:uncharacterized protein YcgI (DUF1989 family)
MTGTIARKVYLKLGLEFTSNPSRTLLEYVDEDEAAVRIIQVAGACVD